MDRNCFGEYADKVVEYRQFQHELGLSDAEAREHPTTAAVLRQIEGIVSTNPEISATYNAVLTKGDPHHEAALQKVRELEQDIITDSYVVGIVNSRVYSAGVRSLLKKAVVVTRAREFMSTFASPNEPVSQSAEMQADHKDDSGVKSEESKVIRTEILGTYIFNGIIESGEVLDKFLLGKSSAAPNKTVAELLNPQNFLVLLTKVMDGCCEGDSTVLKAVRRFAKHSSTKFSEPTTPEASFTKLANSIETGISSFVESNQPVTNFQLLGDTEIMQLSEIYNPNNLLVFAKDLIERNNGEITITDTEMLYRYRTILRCLATQQEVVDRAKARAKSTQKTVKVGARTWAGDIRQYGHQNEGRIDTKDYRDFSEENDEPTGPVVLVNGVEISVPVKGERL